MAALAAVATTLPGAPDAPPDIRRTVESVLSGPEFRTADPSLIDQVLAWLGEQLTRLLGLVAGNDVGQTVFSLALGLIAAGVLVAAVVYARRLRRDRVAEATAVVGSAGVGAAEWAARAERAADAGDLREAVRCRYRGLVADLAERGLVDEIPGRTAGQYLEAVQATVPTATEPFAAATTGFERAWYGHVPVTAQDDAAMRVAVTEATDRVAAATGGGRTGRSPTGATVGASP